MDFALRNFILFLFFTKSAVEKMFNSFVWKLWQNLTGVTINWTNSCWHTSLVYKHSVCCHWMNSSAVDCLLISCTLTCGDQASIRQTIVHETACSNGAVHKSCLSRQWLTLIELMEHQLPHEEVWLCTQKSLVITVTYVLVSTDCYFRTHDIKRTRNQWL